MAGIADERADTLDRFLDEELPELSSGFLGGVPVDDFFGQYLQLLPQQLGQQPRPGAEPLESGETLNYPVAGLSQAMSLDLPLAPDQVQLQPVVSLPDAPGATPFAKGGAAPPPSKPGQSEGSGLGVWEEPAAAAAAAARTRRPASKPEYIQPPDDSEDEDEQDKPKPARGGGKTKRNAKQQVQNKQAQQRYRERRKQRFAEMEQTIDGLNSKVTQMQAVQSQNTLLQAKREELEAMLREKEAELERLRSALESGAAGGGGEGGGGGGVAEERSEEQRRRAEEANLRECQAQVAAHVQLLREFLDAHGLRAAAPSGEGVEGGVLGRLAELVGRGCSICQSAQRAEGVKVLRLMSRDVRHLSRIACLRECDMWQRVLQTLQLSEGQEEQLLLMRRNHLRQLRTVYESRQALNLQAMQLMLPPAERAGSGGGQAGLEGQLACMSLRGYGCAALQSADLDAVLTSIKDNLRLEQRCVMELNFATMHHLLSPLQAALFLVEVHPHYCDALALANMLASIFEQRGRAGDPRGALAKLDSLGSGGGDGGGGGGGGGGRHSPASSENRSDTCPLLRRESSDAAHNSRRPPP